MSYIKEYEYAKERKDEAVRECQSVFKFAIIESVKPVFDKYDNVESLAVWGWTPSYDDGCVPSFRMNIEDAEINDSDIYDDCFGEDTNISYEDAKLIQHEVSEALGVFDEDDWEAAFNSYGFKIVFSKNDVGELMFDEEDYDCGY